MAVRPFSISQDPKGITATVAKKEDMACILIQVTDNGFTPLLFTPLSLKKTMITLRTFLSVFVLAVILPAYAQQRSLIRVIQTPNHGPVAHERAMIASAGLGLYETSD